MSDNTALVLIICAILAFCAVNLLGGKIIDGANIECKAN